MLSGLPIRKLKYPAITICNQGWIDQVIFSATLQQYRFFAKSRGYKTAGTLKFGDNHDFEKLWQETLYPGTTKHPMEIAKAMASPRFENYVGSQTLVNKGPDLNVKCVKKPFCEPGWSAIEATDFNDVSKSVDPSKYLMCLKNYGYSNFTDDKCLAVGANRLHVSSYADGKNTWITNNVKPMLRIYLKDGEK